MTRPHLQLSFEPFLENRRSWLSLRWVIILLASHLALFSHLESRSFVGILVLTASFALTNVIAGLLPLRLFVRPGTRRWIGVADAAFLSGGLFLLRVEQAPLHIPLIGIFVLTLIVRDLRLVLLSVLVVSLLFGLVAVLNLYGYGEPIAAGEFLALALLFLASTFYAFLVASFDREASSSTSVLEESRNSEILVEITRRLSASTMPEDIYEAIVTGLDEVMDGVRCAIVKPIGDQAVFLAVSDAGELPAPTPLAGAKVLVEACRDRQTALVDLDPGTPPGRGRAKYAMAVPMVARGALFGLIYFPGDRFDMEPSSTAIHFLEVVAGTAANALRNVQMLEEMKHLARTDFLTGLPNHRYFQSALAREVGRAHRHHHDLSLLLIDLDFLKSVNDRFGHQAGDTVIREVAGAIQGACREIDSAARYGGEEFVVILPETELDGAVLAAERIRGRIEAMEIERVGKVTASIGVANLPVNASTREGLIRIADQALYDAKKRGRNCVSHFKYQMVTP